MCTVYAVAAVSRKRIIGTWSATRFIVNLNMYEYDGSLFVNFNHGDKYTVRLPNFLYRRRRLRKQASLVRRQYTGGMYARRPKTNGFCSQHQRQIKRTSEISDSSIFPAELYCGSSIQLCLVRLGFGIRYWFNRPGQWPQLLTKSEVRRCR